MKKNLLRIFTLIFLMALLSVNFFATSEKNNAPANVPVDLSFARKLDLADVKKIEREIKALEAEYKKSLIELKLKKERENNKSQLFVQLQNGDVTYRQLFSTTLFVGDSLLNGLEAYNVLSAENTITQVSASLYHLSDNIDKIVANNPENLVLHYGINMLVDNDSLRERFIEMYTELLKRLKEDLPETKIYISGIFNVEPSVESKFPCVGKYNESIEEMCAALNVNYLNNSSLLPGDGGYYGGDGIHLSKAFYTDEWLPFLCFELGL